MRQPVAGLLIDGQVPAYGPAVTRERLVGIDVGGSGVKGAIGEPGTGRLNVHQVRRETPSPSTPTAIAQTVAELVTGLDCPGPVGVTLPCVVQDGIARSAANIDPAWVGTDAVMLMGMALGGRPVVVVNDADAAGLAEAKHGAAAGHHGTVLVLTFGTGIGSALLRAGQRPQTPSSGTSGSTDASRSASPPRRYASRRSSRGRGGAVGSTATSRSWRPCCGWT